ncbi:putative REM family protein [Helianthus debilis subsp. tardiflorus]
MDVLSNNCAFTDGWSKLISDLSLDTWCDFIFSMAGYETFELSVFYHETGIKMYFKKVDVVVLDDPIYGDDGFDLLLAWEHKDKVITYESDVDEDVVGDYMRLSSCGDAYRSHAKPKGKVSRSLTSTSHMPYGTRSKFLKVDDCMVLQEISFAENKHAKPKRKAFSSLTSKAHDVDPKCSTSKKFKKTAVIEFTKKAGSRLNEKFELTRLCTRAEKSGKGFRYGFKKWPAFLKLNHIKFGATLFFSYVKSSQRLMLTKVIHKITKKRRRA